jgi:hypothetical protein
MSDFVLVDMASQRDAVLCHTKGWTKEHILEWLSRYGEVIPLDGFVLLAPCYHFTSHINSDLFAVFRLSDDEFTIYTHAGK